MFPRPTFQGTAPLLLSTNGWDPGPTKAPTVRAPCASSAWMGGWTRPIISTSASCTSHSGSWQQTHGGLACRAEESRTQQARSKHADKRGYREQVSDLASLAKPHCWNVRPGTPGAGMALTAGLPGLDYRRHLALSPGQHAILSAGYHYWLQHGCLPGNDVCVAS